MLAKFEETAQSWLGNNNRESTGADGDGTGTGTGTGFDFNTSSEKQRTLNGNHYNPKAFEQGNFGGIARTTPEEAEASKLQYEQLKEVEKNQTTKNRYDTKSYRVAKNIAKNGQYHLQQRDELGLEIRGAFLETEKHSLENILPGLEDQNQGLGLSQAKSGERIAGIQQRYAERRAKIAALRG